VEQYTMTTKPRKASAAARGRKDARARTVRPAAPPAAPSAAPAAAPADATVRLAASTVIGDVARLREELLPLVGMGAVVTIDAGAVERIDTAALQLLHAFGRERRAAGRELRWGDPSAAFRGAATVLGLSLAGLEPAPGAGQ
jgi:ABC-type transporter Mla MlaB component